MAEDNQIYFIVEEPIPEPAEVTRGERGSRDTGGGWGRGPNRVDPIRTRKKRIPIKSSILKDQLQDMKNVIDELFVQDEQTQNAQSTTESVAKQSVNKMQLEEITLSVQVNAKGELGILGTGGELGGSGGITMKFTRPK